MFLAQSLRRSKPRPRSRKKINGKYFLAEIKLYSESAFFKRIKSWMSSEKGSAYRVNCFKEK